MTLGTLVTILYYICDLFIVLGLLMLLVAGPLMKVYRSINKRAYPSQPSWGEPELLCIAGFILFVVGFVTDHYVLP